MGRSDTRAHAATNISLATHRLAKTDDSWVHDVENFAWKHAHLNIHSSMMIDTLYQLLKGIAMVKSTIYPMVF